MSLKTCLISLLLITLPIITNAATYYKSVDKDGNVEYSQLKPDDSKIERIKVDSYAPEKSSSYKQPTLKPGNNKSADDPNKTAEKTEPEKKLTKKERKEGCASAQSDLTAMNKGQVRTQNEKGETRYLSEQEKQARIKKTQGLIKDNCK